MAQHWYRHRAFRLLAPFLIGIALVLISALGVSSRAPAAAFEAAPGAFVPRGREMSPQLPSPAVIVPLDSSDEFPSSPDDSTRLRSHVVDRPGELRYSRYTPSPAPHPAYRSPALPQGQFTSGASVEWGAEPLEAPGVSRPLDTAPRITAHYAMDGYSGVWGDDAIPGNDIKVTVSDDLNNVVVTGTTWAGSGDSGLLSYRLNLPDSSVLPGYTVTVDFGDGIVGHVVVAGITATPDPDTEQVTGAAPPNSSLHINADCYYGGCFTNLEGIPVDASGNFTADFSAIHDIQYGDRFNAHAPYADTHHDTQYSFWLPAPELQIEKHPTPGGAFPGGTYLYQIHYWNNGNGDAENTVITDTLPAQTTYAGDTSGFPVSDGGGIVTWTLGTVPAQSYGAFYVALRVTPSVSPPAILDDNCVSIGTSSPGEIAPGNEVACAPGIWVEDGSAGIGVDKWSDPGDPCPGEEFHYYIDYWSDTAAATGPVWLTDTLPMSTTLIGWEEVWGWGGLWTEASTAGGQLVLHAPVGIPGNMGGQIRVRLALDPDLPLGVRLANHVIVTTPDDANPGNNEAWDTNAQVSGPRYDLQLQKSPGSGDLTPGGVTDYWLHVDNRGNTAIHAWLTDTLPAGTTYQPGSAGYGHEWGWQPVEPVTVADGYVVWDLGVIGVGRSSSFGFQVEIDDGVTVPGAIENCAEVASSWPDNTPTNNTACVETMLYPDGPNLRVSKSHQWNGDDQLNYRIQIQNIGDEVIPNVVLTDTYPVSTTFDWEWGEDGWRPFSLDFTHNYTDSQVIWAFEYLEPGWVWSAWFDVNLETPGERMRWYAATLETFVPPGDPSPGDNAVTDVAFSGGEVDRIEVWVHPMGQGHLWGNAVPGPVTVTTPYTQVQVWADEGCGGCWNIDNVGPIDGGDPIEVVAGAGEMPVSFSLPDPFVAEVDAAADIVFGQVGGYTDQRLEVHGDWNAGYQEVTTGGDGSFIALYGDIPRGAGGHIRYVTDANYAELIIHRDFVSHDLVITVDYASNSVDANYEPGHTGWVTVTNAAGLTKGAVEVVAEAWWWWNGSSGFSTHHHTWYPAQPDILPGDWIYVTLDDGASAAVQVGIIDVGVNVSTDVVSGTLDVPWFTDPLLVRCEIHEDNAPSLAAYVDPQGGTFICNFSGFWDITPGDNVATVYVGPDENRVLNRPYNPAPYVRVQKWLDGEAVAQGGNAVFTVQYVNEGGLPAEDVIITDILDGFSYVTDTSGLPVSGSGSGPIAWEVGLLPPGDRPESPQAIEFKVFVEVLAAQGEWVTNTIEISTTNPYNRSNWDERHAMWHGEVRENETDLGVGKSAWTGNPAPGEDVVFEINACNHGPTASAHVELTDTAHPSLTLQAWWTYSPGWQETSLDPQQLVLERPSIAAWHCEMIYVRATVDGAAWAGMEITNTAGIFAPNDLSGGNNTATSWVHVSEPYVDLGVNKGWGSGMLVPGGEARYWLGYTNYGNVPVGPFRITDTLPVSTTFLFTEYFDRNWEPMSSDPATVSVVGDTVVWEFAGLNPGFGGFINLVLAISPDAGPGTVLTNTVTITHLPDETYYGNNEGSWTETLFDHGPNLRIRKTGQWDNWGAATRRASYGLNVENIGDVPVWDVTVIDIYPDGMHMDGSLGINFWPGVDWRDNGDHFTATLELLEPGWSAHMNFGLIADADPLPFGLVFTNTAGVMLAPGDVNPGDNVDQVVLTTGPDLYVEKTLVGGSLLPGDAVTYSLVFGNDHWGHENWWDTQGDVWITDTLPSGFSLIRAQRRSWGWGDYPPDVIDGDRLAWNTGTMPASGEDEILLTVLVPADATGADTFTNVAEVASSEPVSDTEPILSNNTGSVTFGVSLPHFEVSKLYASRRVAGMPVTYTLTLENTGHATAATVVLSDTVPAGLIYRSSDGTRIGGDVVWTFPSIAAGSSATGWFRASLPCALGPITNAAYRVMGSDQGVDSDHGNPIVLTVIAPSLQVSVGDSGPVLVGETVYLTATATTDGAGFDYAWDFGAGPVPGGATAQRTYLVDGTHPVTVTVTDDCGFTAEAVAQVQVDPPNLVADFTTQPTPPNIIIGQSVSFADASTTDGPAIVAWHWDFGDGGTSPLQNPTHAYNAAGTLDVTLTVTDDLGYKDTFVAQDLVVVSPACTPLTSVSIAYGPLHPIIHDTVTFTATVLPTTATAPITYTWRFGDGGSGTVTAPTIQHSYAVSGAMVVSVRAYNPCTPAGISRQFNMAVVPHAIYLPLAIRSAP